jgi:protein O-mannosyl-transferase
MTMWFSKHRIFLLSLGLMILVLAVFWPVRHFAFLSYDDSEYVWDNPPVKAGFTAENISWAFTAVRSFNWHPLTWLSHTLDYSLYKDNAGGHHFTSVIFHSMNTLLLFYVLLWMTRALWPSAFVAALFAIHPLHVESVAWISERKDVLSTFFWLLVMLAYVWYTRRGGILRYVLMVFLFTIGLMCKPMLVTLPFALLLLDYWPLERIGAAGWKKILIEKIPLFVLSAVSSFITLRVQHGSGAADVMANLPRQALFANAFVSYLKYIEMFFWPVNLAVFYPHPGLKLPIWYGITALLCLMAITGIIFILRQKYKFALVGWLWYVGTLVPVIGFVQVGFQAMADRYTYVPLIGLFIIFAWGANELAARFSHSRVVVSFACAAAILILSLTAAKQVSYWQNNFKVFQHALSATQNNYFAYNAVAIQLGQQGKLDESIANYRKAIQSNSDYLEAYTNLGCTLILCGRFNEACPVLADAIKRNPVVVAERMSLNAKLNRTSAPPECLAWMYYFIGKAFNAAGSGEQAIDAQRKAAELAKKSDNKALAEDMAKTLKLYEAGRSQSLP